MNAIEVHNVSKAYRMRGLGPQTLFGSVSNLLRRQKPELFWAMNDVSFNIKPGQTIGVIGPNGSGKSSLLGLFPAHIKLGLC